MHLEFVVFRKGDSKGAFHLSELIGQNIPS